MDTAGWWYLRFHAGSGARGRNPVRQLERWAKRIEEAAGDVYAYFNNDGEGFAVKDPRALARMLGVGSSGARGGSGMISTRWIAGAQAAYYVLTGAWSILHRRSFERVTGPKREYWLVRTVGALAIAVGAALAVAVAKGRRAENAVLALASGAAFVAGDLQAARASSRIYLGDALLHLVLLPAWLRRWKGE